MAIAKYSFLPWLRQGISNNIKTNPGSPGIRAEIPVTLRLKVDGNFLASDQDINTDVKLIGPGDIVGLNKRSIVKTEPRNWITDFEPNYLPFIEFYDEDFPWRYTPVKSLQSTAHLTPWITLIVLKDDETEFTETNAITGPLPSIQVKSAGQILPPQSQLWAWAHVHVNKDISPNGDVSNINTVLQNLGVELSHDPDVALSRLFCARELEPNTAYYAFVVPTFESGRLAGLGLDPNAASNVDQGAWSAVSGNLDLPYYHKWYFRTGTKGDFEYLVRLLEPRPVDKRVGVRPMDVQEPGSGIPGISNPPAMGLMGALKSPQTEPTPWPEPSRTNFRQDLAERVNLYNTYQITGTAGGDPLVVPPLYGRWHSLTETLNPGLDKWVERLNLDPRNRVAAGFGTSVVQENQESYMEEAWRQVGDVLEANKRIRYFQMASLVSQYYYKKNLLLFQGDLALSFTAPLISKVLWKSGTAHYGILQSATPLTLLNPAFRRIVRPRGPLMKRMDSNATGKPANLIHRITEGEITATPPKQPVPDHTPTFENLKEQADPKAIPEWLEKLLSKWWFRWMPLFLLILLIIIVLIFKRDLVGSSIVGVLTLVFVGLMLLFNKMWKSINAHNTFKPEGFTRKAVKALGNRPDFKLLKIGEKGPLTPKGGVDNAESKAFKAALLDFHYMFELKPEAPAPKAKLDLASLQSTVFTALNPLVTIPARVLTYLTLPVKIKTATDRIVPVMAYPEFPQPMYEPLRDLSADLLIPNVNLIQQNTISLLETNQEFIESYMVGLNHEMGRELLWREYPTDQRGSYFRQFWDVSSYVNLDESLTEKQLAEKLKDIKPIHTWGKSTELGFHNNREEQGDSSQLVLVIRGDLLKKYPNTVIYAMRAKWEKLSNGNIDLEKPRALESGEEFMKFPLYGAKINPDINFFGFDLTVEEARGGTGEQQTDDPGWFFVLEERPGEPRFGLDTTDDAVPPPPVYWRDLTWKHVAKTAGHIDLGTAITLGNPPADGAPNNPANVAWNANSTSADIAYILYQDPVRIAVHASEMV
ncbi:MAG: hypothetical protein H6581_24905 [Bacteroidia bacterium]|nr:hypothetical protein [Bacteroidia bacterium]